MPFSSSLGACSIERGTSDRVTPMTATVLRRLVSISSKMRRYLALEDFEREARRRLPRMIYGFIAGAAETNAALQNNRNSFERISLLPRVLRNVANRSTKTALFGKDYAAPFGIAPMGAAALCAYRGDLALARAAADSQVPMIVSASSLIRLEEICEAAPGAWFQAYLPGDPERIAPALNRVAAAGFGTLVVTTDVPVPANRENNVRNGFQLPVVLTPQVIADTASHPVWLLQTLLQTLLRHGMPHFENMEATRGPPVFSRNLARNASMRDQLNWEHVALMRRLWKGPMLLKGILAPEDAKLAREHRIDGLIVSNHGGRQLDYAAAPLEVLPDIADQAGEMVVMIDGGIRRGSDVLKALALGARFVFVGRPFLFAAAVGGENAVRRAIALLAEEVDRNMALLGITSLADISSDLLHRTWG
jgi:L-lactate dehydrogenase (cytochrome)